MKKLSLNNKPAKTAMIVAALLSCIVGVVGAFFKIQPVYYCGMAAMAIMLVLLVIAFINAAKEDKAEVNEDKSEQNDEQF